MRSFSFRTPAAALSIFLLAACSTESTAPSGQALDEGVAAAATANSNEQGLAHRATPCGASCLPPQVPANANPGGAACSARSYVLGSSENGSWNIGDCRATDGSARRYDMYEFTITQQAAFRAQIAGHTGRRVSLRKSGTQDYVQLMASEAFMPSNTNLLEVRYILAPGSYVFEVATRDSVTLGDYVLSTSFDAAVTCRPIIFVTTGVTVSERIDPSVDCSSPNGLGVEDLFIILPKAGVRMDMTVTTTAFAPLVVYRDDRMGPASPTLARDVRTTIGATAHVAFTTTFAGFQEIIVSHANPGGSGAYNLTIAEGSAANTCVPIATTAAGSRLAVWESSDCQVDGRLHDSYGLSLTAQTALNVQLISPLGAKSAGIFANGNEVLDFLGGTNNLNATWFLAPGNYELRSGIPAASAPASYTMVTNATNGNIGCTNNATSGGVSFAGQSLATGDCMFNNRFEDRLFVLVEAGREIVVNMTGSVAPAAVIRDPGTTPGLFLVRSGRTDPGSVTARWRAVTTGYYMVIFTTNVQGASGSYVGSISIQ